jgi:hypothetical protein
MDAQSAHTSRHAYQSAVYQFCKWLIAFRIWEFIKFGCTLLIAAPCDRANYELGAVSQNTCSFDPPQKGFALDDVPALLPQSEVSFCRPFTESRSMKNA